MNLISILVTVALVLLSNDGVRAAAEIFETETGNLRSSNGSLDRHDLDDPTMMMGGTAIVQTPGSSFSSNNNNDNDGNGSMFGHMSAHVFSLKDPRTVLSKTVKDNRQNGERWSALRGEDMPRPLHILSFGTSQTYGHGLEDKGRESYPYLITPFPNHVDNLGMPATAADHPSLCLESMIPEADTKSYDVILFEYTFNQSDGTRLLLRRLRERYPDALIVFVNIWNLVSKAVVAETGKGPRHESSGFDTSLNWVWKESTDTFSVHPDYGRAKSCGGELCHILEMEALLEEVGGVSFAMPRPDSVQEVFAKEWFNQDWHHLSVKGHQYLANELARFISKQPGLFLL
jgi:hypothetical protein